ncbi:MAG: hypothetical protein HY320_08255 [Armatimonadetes bacterium]|nr:hypothetical protein [Armatimonadota bacterium]
MADETASVFRPEIDVQEEIKRPRLIALLFCDWGNQTADHKHNLIGTFDRLILRKGRTGHRFYLYVRTAETLDDPINITFFGPGGETVAGPEYRVTAEDRVPGEPVQPQLMMPFLFAPPVEGIYWVDVSYRRVSLGGAALIVEFQEEEDADGTNT